ncbi:MAG TPA: hypothetical protein VL284_16545 [Thermoanaerobaculia bacterium]|nr:hypothetical protein [Thermoanaerobaculia bacterium]
MTAEELVDGFERCTLDSFHHADHVRVVWTYLQRMPTAEALQRFREALQRFAAHQGKPSLYHETITCAYVFLVNERMSVEPSASWEDFCRANDDLLRWRPSILGRYYRPETLGSELARRVFILPDRALQYL